MKPRVLHVGKFYPPVRGGMETHLQRLCALLRPHVDVEVMVAADGRRTTHAVEDGIPVTRHASVAVVASTPLCPGMPRALRRSTHDIVHLHHPNPMAFLAHAASGHRGRLVVTYHSDVVQQRLLGRAFAPLAHHVLGAADAIIATSPEYAASSDVLRRHAGRVAVIPLGTPPVHAPDTLTADVAAIRRRYGDRIVLCVGRLVYYKGVEHLIRAMTSVDGTLLVIGEGPLREGLEQLAARCNLYNRVMFLGNVADVVPYYAAADVFALPSTERSEAFGMVQLEAMAAGTPVVNTALGTGVTFVSPDGVSGFTVPPADPEALAAALNRILRDPVLRSRLGNAAKTRATSEFSEDSMTNRTVELYNRILGTASMQERS